MARACILNYNNRGRLLLEKLRVEGRIDSYEYVGNAMFCFEFSRRLELDISDYMDVSPDYLYNTPTKLQYFIEEFKRAIVLTIINTLQNGRVAGFTSSHIEIEPTDKTETVCFRVTKEEKQKLKEAAEKEGLTLSDYIRKHLLKTTTI